MVVVVVCALASVFLWVFLERLIIIGIIQTAVGQSPIRILKIKVFVQVY